MIKKKTWVWIGGLAMLGANVWAMEPVIPAPVAPRMDAALASPAGIASANPAGDETPNQRRRRMGLPIVETYPAQEYGEAIETPNQRRRRLGQRVEASYEESANATGVAEETPNQRRARLAR